MELHQAKRRETIKPSKMADKTFTQELHNMIFGENYAMTVELTDTDDCINSQELYHLCKYTSKTCNLITMPLIDKKGQAIPSGVFTLFTKYTSIPPGSIRDDLLSWASEHEEEIVNLSKHYFKRDKLNFTGWYVKTLNSNNTVDELCLFLLCKQHMRHAILVNRSSFWSTLNKTNLGEINTCHKSDLGQLPLGQCKYAYIENKTGYKIADMVKLIREYFSKRSENTKRKHELSKKLAECNVHQNRSKRQKREVDYLEMNVGKCRAQPRRKLPPKKIDIVAALREPSETRLAAHHIQEDCRNYKPGQILGVAIKMEIKTEVKQELEKINTRHRYKGKPLWGKPNYIHPNGTPCKRSLREESQLPDLLNVADNLLIG